MHILLIEDDNEAASYIVKGLEENGHIVDHVSNGEDGAHMALTEKFDALIIDRMLPKRDGLSIIKLLRADNNTTPVLILSALGDVDDRIEGLRSGGDDYLVKPYAFGELLARLNAIIRRHKDQVPIDKLTLVDLEYNLINHKVTRAGKVILLQPKEMQLLEYLLRNAEQVVTRTMLLEQVWSFHFDPGTNVIDTQVSRLRQKIDRDFPVKLLKTIRGKGYKLSASE